jgi:serine protease Do
VTIHVKRDKEFQTVKKEKVKIVALNPYLDLALLKIEEGSDPPLKKVFLGDSDQVRAGDMSFAIGSPFGFSRTVTQGIVSLKNREREGKVYLQTTAPVNPGNSGGPLFNDRGEVVGVVTWKIAIVGEGLGFAIPVNAVKDFLRNRDAFAYDKDNPNTGVRYFDPPKKPR